MAGTTTLEGCVYCQAFDLPFKRDIELIYECSIAFDVNDYVLLGSGDVECRNVYTILGFS